MDWPVAPQPGDPGHSAPQPDPAPPPTAAPPITAPHDEAVLVVSGDTLWAIATDSLTAGASNRKIANAVGAWFLANRAVIGPDPDLIFPGQRLVPPPGAVDS